MAVLNDAVSLKEKGYATMAKSTVVPFELPSEFSPDPLTEVIQNGEKAQNGITNERRAFYFGNVGFIRLRGITLPLGSSLSHNGGPLVFALLPNVGPSVTGLDPEANLDE